ncbi:MAG: serine/threonine-protein kinase [Gemmatimonadota bacterium]
MRAPLPRVLLLASRGGRDHLFHRLAAQFLHFSTADRLTSRSREALHVCRRSRDGRCRVHSDESSPAAGLPRSIGPFRILKLLGEGGMGLVYEAEQRAEVRRRVALKVMRPGLDADQVLARFEAERQALAVMQHPGIARLFDAGVTEDDRPYFVMELVDGEPLTDYADGNKLPVADRLRLFVRVCHAVQHAHLKGVVHRDLKPSNVLVTVRDDVPTPKIIDFGIAKATGEPLTERTLVTQFGQALGTPAYMSPEQAGATGLDVDSRTDVYSLGVTLYELLVGRLPIDPREVGPQGFFAQLVMKESDPPTPSTRFSTLDQDFQSAIAHFRRTDPGSLRSEVHGDLDWIVMKAMDKDRERRYETANALAADLERYLADEPVLARPPSARYRAGKFVRRHRWGVGVAALIASLLAVSTVLLSAQAAQLRRERDRAEVEAHNAEAVLAFMDGLFDSPDPYRGNGPDVTVVQMLDVAVPKLLDEFEGAPIARAAAMDAIGRAYLALDRFDDARPLLKSALDIRRSVLGDTGQLVASSVNNYAAVLDETDDFAEAEPLYREAIARFRAIDGEDSEMALKATANLAQLLDMRLNRFDEAEELYQEVISVGARILDPADEELALWRQNYAGFLCYERKEPERGVRLLQQAIPALEQARGQESVNQAIARSLLGYCLTELGEFEQAEGQLLRALPILEAKLGADHRRTQDARDRLAHLYRAWGRPEQADVHGDEIGIQSTAP